MTKRLIAITLAASLLLACGCSEKPAEGGEAPLPEKLILDFDTAAVAVPETAAVITANRVIFEPDEVTAALLRHDVEESHEGEGVVWRYSTDELFEYLLLAQTGTPEDEVRNFNGRIAYHRYPAILGGNVNIPWRVEGFLSPYSAITSRLSANVYLGSDDFEDMTAANATGEVEGILQTLGISEGVENTKVLRLSVEDQLAFIDTYLSDAEREGYTAETEAFLSDAYVLEYRQMIDGIPVCSTDWHRGVDGTINGLVSTVAEMQRITAAVSADGSLAMDIQDVFDIVSTGEQRSVLSCDEAVQRLIGVFSDTIMLTNQYVVSAELCYAIFETRESNEVTLHPMWIFSVLDEDEYTYSGYAGPETGSYSFTTVRPGTTYAFDAFTGERIASVELPKSAG